MIGLLGAINIPFYEEMARRIHWWQYNGCRMISLRRGTLFSASLGLRSPSRCLREHFDTALGAKLSFLESAVDFRSLFVTPLPFGLRIDWLSRDEDKSAWVGSHSDI